jgi:hypothetical protein
MAAVNRNTPAFHPQPSPGKLLRLRLRELGLPVRKVKISLEVQQ